MGILQKGEEVAIREPYRPRFGARLTDGVKEGKEQIQRILGGSLSAKEQRSYAPLRN